MTGSVGADKGKGQKSAAIISAVLWMAGFVIPFCTPPRWQFYWVSDTLLLLGFWPVMFVHPAGWTWLLFGICNVAIGVILKIGNYLPDNVFPPSLLPVKAHMADFHEPLMWILIGVISTIYGIIRIIKHLLGRGKKKSA